MTFNLTRKQSEQLKLLASDATHVMAYGGSRSGKTFGFVRAVIIRALAHKSRHAMLRYRFNHIKASIVLDTLPKVMDLCFPGVAENCRLDKTDWYYTLPNGSEVWFGGLDDKERTEKILGQEYATLYLNECSQIPYASRNMAMTRLAQKTPLRLKAYYDCVSGDTVLDGQTKTIAELAFNGKPIMVQTTHGARKASAPWMNGISRLYLVRTASGRSLRVTSSHQFWTPEGWRRLSEISTGQKILCSAQRPSHGGGLNDPAQIEKQPGLQGNCYKYHRRCDGLSHSIAEDDQACLASSCDEEGHSRYPSLRALQGCHKGCHETREALRTRHTPKSHEPLVTWSALSSGRTGHPADLPASGLSLRTRPSGQRSVLKGRLVGSGPGYHSADACPLSLSSCSEAIADASAIYRQWLRYSRLDRRYLGPSTLASISPTADLLAHDTPLMDGYDFETVVEISFSATDATYTVEVPFINHYSAAGVVSHNCNPPGMSHWTYRLFVEKRDPDRRTPVANPGNFAALMMNPKDNEANLDPKYLEELQSMSEGMRRRFWLGQFADISDSALWTLELLDQQRIVDGDVPDMVRIVVAVDPSGVSGEEDKRSDEVGIVVCGLGKDGRGYVLEDLSGRMPPSQWGAAVVAAYDRHDADCVVAEENFGGAMVAEIIRSAATAPTRVTGGPVPYRAVKASRGKVVRAEPIAALFQQQKVSMVGLFPDLEDQLCAMTTAGYVGSRSPDRADAMVWGLFSLFPGMTKQDRGPGGQRAPTVNLGYSSMKGRRK